jgi:hypothetical protein
VVVKKNHKGLVICVDYGKLNKKTYLDLYSLSKVQDIIDLVSGKQWCTLLDLTSGFLKIPLSKNSRYKTAFRTIDGLYQFKVMPILLQYFKD